MSLALFLEFVFKELRDRQVQEKRACDSCEKKANKAVEPSHRFFNLSSLFEFSLKFRSMKKNGLTRK